MNINNYPIVKLSLEKMKSTILYHPYFRYGKGHDCIKNSIQNALDNTFKKEK